MKLALEDLAVVVTVIETQVGGNWSGRPLMKKDEENLSCIKEYVLKSIRPDIEKDFVTEQPVSAKCRLAICLYRLGSGDYLYTIAELFGVGLTTVHKIIEEVLSNHQREYYGENGGYDSVMAIPLLLGCCRWVPHPHSVPSWWSESL